MKNNEKILENKKYSDQYICRNFEILEKMYFSKFRNFDQYICRAQVFSVYFFPYSRFINTQKFPVYKYTKIPGKNTNENFEISKNTQKT